MDRPKCKCGGTDGGLIYMLGRYWCVLCVERRIAELERKEAFCKSAMKSIRTWMKPDFKSHCVDAALILGERITDLERRVKALEEYAHLSADVPTTELEAMAAFRKAMLSGGR